MPHEIFTKEVFEKQNNGSVFYKEGKLNDFPYAGAGIFESWRYNFDSGKQVFRAEKSNKVFEKRLVKDQYGNPKWTGWIEVPDAEAHGIQAIAINDRPLQLPNTDGAIKLQITPAIIDAYTKKETYDLIEQKISDYETNKYTYVSWCMDSATGKWAADAITVLKITFPEGGVKDHTYLVEPHPSTSGIHEKASYFIWDETTLSNGTTITTWIEINPTDLRSFVSYPVFDEHCEDFHFHLSGQFERDYWNQKVNPEDLASGLAEVDNKIDEKVSGIYDTIDEKTAGLVDAVSGVQAELHEHIADADSPTSPHLGPEDRAKLIFFTENFKEMIKDGDRYVSQDGEWVKAYEQVDAGPAQSELFFEVPTFALQNNKIVVDGIDAKINELLANNKQIIGFQLEATIFQLYNSFLKFKTDTGKESPTYSTTQPVLWALPFEHFDSITANINPTDRTAQITNVKFYIRYRTITGIKVGDPLLRLPINLIGPTFDPANGIEPMYNGVPLSKLVPDAAKTAEWGRISGVISNQIDLREYIVSMLNTKVNKGPFDSHLRYDIYRDGILPSLIQQPGSEHVTKEIKVGDISHLSKDAIVIDNVQNLFTNLIENGFLPYHGKLKIEFVACYNKNDADPIAGFNGTPIPVYFQTDNDEIVDSPEVSSGPFTFDWPGNTFHTYNKIFLRGWNVEHLDNVKLEVSCIKLTDAFFKNPDYQIFIEATNIHNNASGTINSTAKNGYFNITAASGGMWDLGNGKVTEISSGRLVDTKDGDYTLLTENANINVKENTIIKSKNIRTDVTKSQFRAQTAQERIENYTGEIVSGLIKSDKFEADIKDLNVQTDTFNIDNSDLITVNGKIINIETTEEFDVKSEDKLTLTGDEELNLRSKEEVNIVSEKDINIGTTFAYDASVLPINIYGQEADKRYASRARFETASGVFHKMFNAASGFFDKTYKEASGYVYRELEKKIDRDIIDTSLNEYYSGTAGSGNMIVQDITFEYDEASGNLSLKKTLVSLKDGSVDVYSGIDFDIYTETEAANYSGVVSGLLFEKADKNIVDVGLNEYYSGTYGTGNKVVQDITFTLDDQTGELNLKKTLISIEDGAVDVYSGTYDLVTEAELDLTNKAISGEIYKREIEDIAIREERISGDAYLQSQLDDLVSDVYTKDEIDDKFDDYYTINDIDTKLDDYYLKTETYNQTEIDDKLSDMADKVDAIVNEGTESYDLVVLTNAQLAEVLENGTFENAKRILIDRDVTEYLGTKATIDFSNIEYLKGEERCSINLPNTSFENYDEVLFNTIKLTGFNKQLLDSEERRVKEYNLNGDAIIELTKYYDIYQLNLNDDSKVTFENVLEGKEYIFYIDQQATVKQFALGNHLHNALELLELTTAFEAVSQSPQGRTVIKAIGTNNPNKNGFIITEVITNVGMAGAEGFVEIIYGKTIEKVHSYKNLTPIYSDTCVKNLNGAGLWNENSNVIIKADPANTGWKNISAKVHYLDSDTILKEGLLPLTFTVPKTSEKIIIDFYAEPVLVNVVMSPVDINRGKINEATSTGFTNLSDPSSKYQVFYNEVILDIKALPDYFLWKTIDGLGNDYQASMPWKFKIPNRQTNAIGEEIDDLFIYPQVYLRIVAMADNIEVISNPSIGRNFFIKDIWNIFKYNYTTAHAPLSHDVIDPIQIISFTPVDSLEIENANKVFPKIDGSITLTINTASGFTKTLTVVSNDGVIGTVFIDGPRPFYKGGLQAGKHKYEIDWGTTPPTLTTGTWSVNRTDITVDSNGVVTIPAGIGTGKFTLMFTPDVNTSLTFSDIIDIHQLPDNVEVLYNGSSLRATVKTTSLIPLELKWTPLSGDKLTNPIGKWESDDTDYIDFDDDTIGIMTVKDILTDATKVIIVTFTSDDPSYNYTAEDTGGPFVTASIEFKIIANEYSLSFTGADDPNYEGVSFTNGYEGDVSGGTLIRGRIQFKHGFTLDDSVVSLITGQLNGSVVVGNAFADFTFNMPFENLEIKIVSKIH